MSAFKSPLGAIALGLIRAWRLLVAPGLSLLAPATPSACRFEPSCSHYAEEAVRRHGAVRGARLALIRLWRCRPGGGAGFDPVPPAIRENHPADQGARP